MKFTRRVACAAGLLTCSITSGQAGLLVVGSGISGDFNVADGTTLWSLVGGVTTTVPPGFNDKNAILHNYVVALGAAGAESVFSLGEIDPAFGGTNLAPTIG